MYGTDMGTLRVVFATGGINAFYGLWGVAGNQGNQWNTASVNIPAGDFIIVRIVFNIFMYVCKNKNTFECFMVDTMVCYNIIILLCHKYFPSTVGVSYNGSDHTRYWDMNCHNIYYMWCVAIAY